MNARLGGPYTERRSVPRYTFIATAEIHYHHALGIELHHRHRGFVDNPQIVVAVKAHRVRVGQAVDATADFAHIVALFVEFQNLRCGFAIYGTGTGASGMIQDDDVAFRIDGPSQDIASIGVGSQDQDRH